MRNTIWLALLGICFATPAYAGYRVDWSWQETDTVFWDGSGSVHGGSCDVYYGDGVVRSWSLKERNLRDYRKSHTFCRDMKSDGTLAAGNEKTSHFSYSGDGCTGNTSIPLDKLPTGVRTRWDFPLLGDLELVDVELFFDDAGDIIAGRTDADRAGSARGNSGGRVDLTCSPGLVLTGIQVLVRHRSGGPNQAEIHGVKIECTLFEETFTVQTAPIHDWSWPR